MWVLEQSCLGHSHVTSFVKEQHLSPPDSAVARVTGGQAVAGVSCASWLSSRHPHHLLCSPCCLWDSLPDLALLTHPPAALWPHKCRGFSSSGSWPLNCLFSLLECSILCPYPLWSLLTCHHFSGNYPDPLF